jgi:autotransporter translocation and assembly factor TamB
MTAKTESPKSRKWLKRGLIASVVVVSLILCLILAVRILVASDWGRSYAESRIEALTIRGQSVEIEGLEGDLLRNPRLRSLTIMDRDGIWLEAKDVRVSWSYWPLLSGQFVIDEARIKTLDILRQPVLAPVERSTDRSGNGFLSSYEVAGFTIEKVTVSEGLTPQTVQATFDGDFKYSDKAIRGSLDFESLETDSDRLNLNLDWTRGKAPIADYQITSQNGGVLATLLALEQDQTLTGEGQLGLNEDAVFGTARMGVDGDLVLTANLEERDARVYFDAEVRPDAHEIFAPYRAALSETIEITASARRDDLLSSLTATIQTEGSSMTLKPIDTRRFEIEARIQRPDRFLQSDFVTIQMAALNGKIALGDPLSFDGDTTLKRVTSQTFSAAEIAGPLGLSLSGALIGLKTDLAITGLSAQNESRVPSALNFSATASMDRNTGGLNVSALSVTANGLKAQANGDIDLESLTGQVRGQVRANGTRLGIGSIETVTSNWTATRWANGLVAARLNGRVEPANMPTGFDAPIDYTARINTQGDGGIRLEALKLTQFDRTLSATGTRSASGAFSARVKGEAPTLLLGQTELESVAADFELSLSETALKAEGYVEATRLKASGVEVEGFTAVFSEGNFSASETSTSVNLTGQSFDERFEVATRLDYNLPESRLSLTDLNGAWGSLKAVGSAALFLDAPQSSQVDLKITGTAPDLVPADTVRVDFSLRDQSVTGSSQIDGLELNGLSDGALAMTFNGDLSLVETQIKFEGRTDLTGQAATIRFYGPVRLENALSDTRVIQVSGDAEIGDLAIAITEPARFFWDLDYGLIGTARLALADGTLDFALRPETEDRLTLDAENLKLSPFLILAGQLPRDGQAGLNLTLDQNTQGNLQGTGRFTLSGLRGPQGRQSDFKLSSNLSFEANGLSVELQEAGLEDLEFAARAAVPFVLSAKTLAPTRISTAPTNFEIRSFGEIGPVADLFLPSSTGLSGNIDLDINGTLPPSGPVATGSFRLQDGTFEQVTLGLELNTIDLAAGLEPGALTIKTLSASGRSGGTITGGGLFSFEGLAASQSSLKVDRLVIFERPEGRATASGTLNLESQNDRPLLRGELQINEALIDLEKLPKAGPPTLDVQFETPGDEEQDQTASGFIGIDVTLTSERGIRVTGRGVNALMGVRLSMENKLVSPSISGEVKVVRGVFDLLGKRFELSPTTMVLEDDIGASSLNIVAEREADGFTYTVTVSGTADRPEIELSSTPELPEDEVLSRVLFGRSPSQLTGLEAARLAAALAQSTGGGGFDLLGGLEQQLGLDRLSLDASDDGATSLTTGKYLAEDVYVEVQTGRSGAPGLSIEWQPLDNLEVEAETAPDEGQTLSLKWKRDFD